MPEPKPEPKQTEIRFHQQKGSLFRSVHADGVWWSMGPHGNLHLVFYTERLAMPTETFYPLTKDNELGKEIVEKRVGGMNYERDMEVDVVLNWKNVLALHDYLGNYIEANKAK